MDKEEPENVISVYTDREAVDDGFLVAIRRGPVNRVTRAVFDHFTAAMGDSSVTGTVTDVTRLMQAIEADAEAGSRWRRVAHRRVRRQDTMARAQ